jgi:hypothetical protein
MRRNKASARPREEEASRERPEAARRKSGLGERTPEGETIKATPRGRHPRPGNPARPAGRVGSKAAAPRAARAKRRTTRDNPR